MTNIQRQVPEASVHTEGPEPPRAENTEWKPTTSSKVGWKGLSAAQLRDAAFADSDPRPA